MSALERSVALRTAVAAVVALALALALPRRAGAQDAPGPADFFDDTVVHDLRLAMHAGDWELLQARCMENTYYPVDVEWRGLVVRNAGVRSRGTGSRDPRKPALKLDFDRYVDGQRFVGLKALDLDNFRQDAGMMKELVSMQFFRKMGIAAPRAVHARVYVNGTYMGLYAVLESVDKTFLKAAFGENDGHLYEYEWQSGGYRFEWLGPDLSAYAPYFKPQTREEESPQQLFEPIAAMVATANHTPDDQWAQAMSRFFDLDLLLAYLAVEAFLADHDGLAGDWGLNNFYLYRFEDGDRFQLIPWDKDYNFREPTQDVFAGLDGHALLAPALRLPTLRASYVAALRRCAAVAAEQVDGDGRGWLEREIAREAALIRPAAHDDRNKAYANDRFEQEVDWMVAFARYRGTEVLRQVGAGTER